MAYALAPDHQTHNISPATQNHKSTLIIGIEQSIPLIATGTADKTDSGLTVALWKAVAADVGLNYHIAMLSFTDLLKSLNQAKLTKYLT